MRAMTIETEHDIFRALAGRFRFRFRHIIITLLKITYIKTDLHDKSQTIYSRFLDQQNLPKYRTILLQDRIFCRHDLDRFRHEFELIDPI